VILLSMSVWDIWIAGKGLGGGDGLVGSTSGVRVEPDVPTAIYTKDSSPRGGRSFYRPNGDDAEKNER